MANVVLGMWTTHGPMLSTTPDEWLLRLPADHANKQHPFRGGKYDFESLVALRKDENLAFKSSLVERTKRHDACRTAIDRMATLWQEVFVDKLMPALSIFNGPTIWNGPASESQAKLHPPGIHAAEWGHKPPVYTEYPGHPELANRLIGSLVTDGFDITRVKELPQHNDGHWHSGIGHAFGFIYRQIMRDKVVPNVPIIANTFFPPNQPTARRCFELGRAVGRALKAWQSDARIAVFGSGGMSHFVIDEQLDQTILNALANRDGSTLTAINEDLLQSGSSELKNWIAAAGLLFETDLSGGVIDYQPCYRSEAGTGTANGFVAWR
jgi:Catalytic LigB subunit of aromatic ring-opening dioxygenase